MKGFVEILLGLFAIVGIVLGGIGLIFVCLLMPTFIGAFLGWIVGWIFPGMMASLLSWTGAAMSPWQFGAALGFIGGFLRWATRVTVNKDRD